MAFMREILGVEYTWDLMDAMAQSVRVNRRTAVAGCHDSSKTFTAAGLAWWWVCCFAPAKVVVTSPKEDQIRKAFWVDLKTLYEESRVAIGGEMMSLEWRSAHPDTGIFGMTARKDTGGDGSSGMQGYKSPRLLLIMDEAVGIDRAIFESAIGLLGSHGSRWLAMANPTNPACGFHDCWLSGSGWNCINISAFDTPNIRLGKDVNPYTPNQEWLAEMRRYPGEGTPSWDARVLGRFPKTAIDTLIGIEDLDMACDRKPVPIESGCVPETWVGVDLAAQGDDRSAIVVIRNNEIAHLEASQETDLMTFADHALGVAEDYGIPKAEAHRISIDSGGLGEGVLSYMRRLGWHVNGENFGRKARNPDRFYLRRMEMWWGVRDWLRSDAALVKVTQMERRMLESDLCGCKVKREPHAGFDVLKLEPKIKMKERLGHSPDIGDAVALALAWRTKGAPLNWSSFAGRREEENLNPRVAGPYPEDRSHPGHDRYLKKQGFYGQDHKADFYGE